MPRMQYKQRNDAAIATCQEGLRPLLYWMQYICARDGRDFLIICGFRGEAEQNNAYKSGNSHAKWPDSFHNHGAAIDLVPVMFGIPWKLKWYAFGRYARAASIFKQWGFEWGGDWTSFKDNPHFQYTEGKTIGDFVNGFQIRSRKYLDQVHTAIERERTKLEKGMEHAINSGNTDRVARLRVELEYLHEVADKMV